MFDLNENKEKNEVEVLLVEVQLLNQNRLIKKLRMDNVYDRRICCIKKKK